MPQNMPTTKEIKDQNLANYESKLNQTSPLADKAFLRVQSAVEALIFTILYKYGADRARQALAITATGDGLKLHGDELDVVKVAAVATVLTFELPGTDTTVIPAGTDFIGDSNGVRYFSDSSATITGGVATITATAETPGVAGNLNVSDTLSLGTQIAGAENTATVTVIETTGAEEETEESFRTRILFAKRATSGGNNSTDYKTWSEEVAGVKRAYPFSGKFFGSVLDSFPGDRTIYIEAVTSVHPDGIAPGSLLDSVREAINTNSETSRSRPLLGLSDATLDIRSISRRPFYVNVINLDVDAGVETQVKADIEAALTTYFLTITPFVDGIDLPQERNDLITDVSLSAVVQSAITDSGGSVDDVDFGIVPAVFTDISYRLDPGELAKLGSVTYSV
jgi:hypothetical protein